MDTTRLRRRAGRELRRAAERLSPSPPSADAPAAPAHDPVGDVLRLLFPHGVDDATAAHARALVGDRDPYAPETLRRVLGALDLQGAPTPLTVRFGPDSLERVDIGGVLAVLDRHDMGISAQVIEGHYEQHVAAVLDRLLRPGTTFVDVGANVGFHALRAAARLGGTGTVVAFEPSPENVRLMLLSVRENGITNLEVMPVAIADRIGWITFAHHLGSNAGVADDGTSTLIEGAATVVPCFMLDSFHLDVDVLKIDVEGAEALVVDGAMETIARSRPIIVVEHSQEMAARVTGRDPHAHLDRLVELGYQLQVIDRTTRFPGPVTPIDELFGAWDDPVRIEDLLLIPRPG